MKKNTKAAPKTASKPLNVFKLKAGELKMIHGGKGVIAGIVPPIGMG